MKVKLAVQDFQGMKRAVLEFEPGITIITGPSGSGKTALFRALESLLLNNRRGSIVRRGAVKARVALKLGDAEPIYWERTQSQSGYKIGGTIISSAIGRNNLYTLKPPDVELPFLLWNKRIVSIQNEWDILFPFEFSPSELFTVFEDIFQVTNAKLIDQDLKATGIEIKRRMEEAVKENEGYVRKDERISAFFARHSVVDSSGKERVQRIATLIEQLKAFGAAWTVLEKAAQVLRVKVPAKKAFVLNLSGKVMEIAKSGAKLWKLMPITALVLPSKKSFKLDAVDGFLKMGEAQGTVNSLFGSMTKGDQEKVELVREYEKVLAELHEYKVCPICGKSLEEDDDVSRHVS